MFKERTPAVLKSFPVSPLLRCHSFKVKAGPVSASKPTTAFKCHKAEWGSETVTQTLDFLPPTRQISPYNTECQHFKPLAV